VKLEILPASAAFAVTENMESDTSKASSIAIDLFIIHPPTSGPADHSVSKKNFRPVSKFSRPVKSSENF
jgi:hypothetical protein